ncbi:MAG TPA: class I SAM-dependent methyltransferase [Flavobacteriales bacterium]|nr:class I SAM-dependent methyltransferase [Flavobacteriales bacterium]
MQNNKANHVPGQGVRKLTLKDQLPQCEIFINATIYDLKEVCCNRNVVDIGCGYGANRSIVEAVGGRWTGVEPFEGGAHTVVADAENLPFNDASFDVVIMDAVLEHIPNASAAFSEVGRILKKGGIFIGYVAFMECFHEISYSHLSFKALEHFSAINGMKLEKISGGHRFGIDYHKSVLYYPLSFKFMRAFRAWKIRSWIKLKSKVVYCYLRFKRKESREMAGEKSRNYYKLECLRQSNGFNFIIRKL